MLVHLTKVFRTVHPVQESTLLSKETDGINEEEKQNKLLNRLCLKVCSVWFSNLW